MKMKFGIAYPITEKRLPKELHPGNHPGTGEPLTHMVVVEMEREMHQHQYLPPREPTRELWEYPHEDADMPVYVRELTEAEYQVEMKAYRKAMRQWEKDGGIIHTPGPVHTTGVFRTRDGSQAEGEWTEGRGWLWFKYDTVPRPKPKPRVSARYRS